MPLFMQIRELHRRIAPLVILPLLITVCSGVSYRLARDWFGFSRDQVHWLMVLHEGEWLGAHGETIYVLLNGLGLIWMLSTGLLMLLGKWLR